MGAIFVVKNILTLLMNCFGRTLSWHGFVPIVGLNVMSTGIQMMALAVIMESV
jgi:hypothetical protein